VPYSADAPYDTKAVSPYNISAGGVSKIVEVKESDIMNGTVIDIGYLKNASPPVPGHKPSLLNLSERWIYDTKGEIRSFVSIKGDTVYAASMDGIYALHPNGQLKWEYRADSEPFPVLENDLYAVTRNGILYALDSNGRLIWKVYLNGKAYAAPLFHEGVLYAGSDHGLHAIEAGTGKIIWDYDVDGAVIATPVISNNTIYIISKTSDTSVVQALDLKSRMQKWKKTKKQGLWSFPVIANNIIIFGARDNTVYGLNASTGELLWTYGTGSMVDSTPSVLGEIAYIGSYDGKVHAINISSGERVWKSRVMAPIYAKPVLAGDMVIVGTWDKTLYVLDRETGIIIGKYTSGGSITAPASVMNRTIYAGAKDGKLYALGY
jgi:outer membrane protein assembly factor BamB